MDFIETEGLPNARKTRQKEEIGLAKKQERHLGRPKAKLTSEFMATYNAWKLGVLTAGEAMKQANVAKLHYIAL